MPSFVKMHSRKEALASEPAPLKTMEVCNRCGSIAYTMQTVHTMIGYRRSNGKMITQANCHECRSLISASPKKPTGKNKKKMETSLIVLGKSSQRRRNAWKKAREEQAPTGT